MTCFCFVETSFCEAENFAVGFRTNFATFSPFLKRSLLAKQLLWNLFFHCYLFYIPTFHVGWSEISVCLIPLSLSLYLSPTFVALLCLSYLCLLFFHPVSKLINKSLERLFSVSSKHKKQKPRESRLCVCSYPMLLLIRGLKLVAEPVVPQSPSQTFRLEISISFLAF